MVSHVDRKQLKDTLVQRMQNSIIIVTIVTKEEESKAGLAHYIYRCCPEHLGPKPGTVLIRDLSRPGTIPQPGQTPLGIP